MITFIAVPTLILAIALLICRFFQNRLAAASRHLILTTSFIAILLAPVAPRLIPSRLPIRQIRSSIFIRVTPQQQAQTAPASSFQLPEIGVMATTAWATGVLLFLVQLGIGLRCLSKSRSSAPHALARAAALGIDEGIRVLESPDISIPEARGLVRPFILLPASAESWSPERLDLVLIHEAAHIRRHDFLWSLLAELASALHWYNPLTWIALKQLREQRELAVDDEVLRAGIDAPDYASHLIEIASGVQQQPSLAIAMAQQSSLEARVRSILDTRTKRGGITMQSKLAAAGAVCLALIVISAGTVAAQDPAALIGSVQDVSKAFVPNATILLQNTATNAREIARTDDAGEFRFRNIPSGRYTMQVMKPGFKPYTAGEIDLAPQMARQVSVVLDVGSINETVNVTAQRVTPVNVGPGQPKRLRIGGNVQAAKLIHKVNPEYPDSARKQGIEGTVLLDAVISREGQVLSLKLANTDVNPDLANAALAAVQQWVYQPTLLNGEPVEIVTSVMVQFTLTK